MRISAVNSKNYIFLIQMNGSQTHVRNTERLKISKRNKLPLKCQKLTDFHALEC